MTAPILFIISCVLFVALSIGVRLDFFSSIDSLFNTLITPLQTEGVVSFTKSLTNIISDPFIVIPLAFFVYILLLYSEKRSAYIFLLSYVYVVISVFVLKMLIGIPRPEHAFLKLSDMSYPSGHTAYAFTLFFVSFAIPIRNIIKKRAYNILQTLLFIGVCAVAFSRVILGVHRLSELLGGILIALICVLLAKRSIKNRNTA